MKVGLEKIKADPRVESVWDESGGANNDGYWVNLKRGFADLADDPCQPTHTIHEWSIAKLRARMRDVKPCTCPDCKPTPKQ